MQKFNEILHEKLNTSVALGFFDGLHKGHRRVIAEAVSHKKNGLVPVCFTFAQSPKSILLKADKQSLMTDYDKMNALSEIGIEHTCCIDFCSIMNMSAESFVKDIIADKLNAKHVSCGFNYRFGKNGEGDTEMLKKLCSQYGIVVCVVPPEKSDEDIISSTLIRGLIKNGDICRANELLCSYFGFSSEVEHGKRLGRRLGTPTLNQPLCKELVVPRFGVYASAVTLENGDIYCGVTNIGVKPTVGSFAPLCETWMPQYNGSEIYGEKVDIRLLKFLRDEKKFDNIDDLKNMIIENGNTAVKIFNDIFNQ